jgi:hypothetical protein
MKRLKLLLTALLICFVTSKSVAQSTNLNLSQSQVEVYIAEVYGEGFVNNNPTLVDAFKVLLNDRISFQQIPVSEEDKYPLLTGYNLNNKWNSALPNFIPGNFNVQDFNPLRYGFDFFSGNTQIIRVDGTDYVMIVLPQ